MADRIQYAVISGEGSEGTWELVETDDIHAVLKRERCAGDRWARAYRDLYQTTDGDYAGYNVETGERGIIPASAADREEGSMTYYKVLAEGGSACHGGSGKWHLPKGKRPGKWMPKLTDITPCQRGYHLVTLEQLPQWLGATIWVAEGRGEHIKESDKHVFSQARLLCKVDAWNERTARIFVCDCAERVLPIFEREYPNEKAPRNAIETARRFADGKATSDELAAARDAARAAARDAAWDAARGAAGDAAWAAAGDAAWGAAWAAAWAVARAVARDAAWDAALAAAGAAERAWQSIRLAEILGLDAV